MGALFLEEAVTLAQRVDSRSSGRKVDEIDIMIY
jgi:hypothetical protein